MFGKFLRKPAKFLRSIGNKSARSPRPRWSALVLESLESRDLPAPLTWAGGVTLPAPAGGSVAQAEGAKLLILAGPTTTSYNATVTNPAWQATVTPTVQPLDFARTSPGVGLLSNGYSIVFGGSQNGFAISNVTQYDPNTVTVGDGATNQTRSLRSMNAPRALLDWATNLSTYQSYAIGGEDNNGTPLASVEVYNSSANSWSFVAALPQTLYSESAVSDGAGHLYTFGGVGANGSITNTVYRYTIATNTWDQVAPMQVGVRDSAAVLGPNGLIYVLGGTTASGTTATVESYNITTNTWTLESSLPQAMNSEAATVDSLGRIEVLGGYDANGNPLASTYVSQEFTQPDLAPTITSTPPTTAVVNSNFAYQVLSTGNPQPVYTLTSAPTGMTINGYTGLVNWTPTAVGSYSVTVQASNGVGVASQSFSLQVVLPTPAAPTGVAATYLSTTTASLSWNASSDPNVTSYSVYQQHVTTATLPAAPAAAPTTY